MILILIVYNCRIVAIIKRHKIAVFFYTYVRVLHRLTIGTVDQQIWFVRHVFVLPGSFTLFTEKTSLCQATRRQGAKASLFIAFCVRTPYVFLEDIDWTGWLCLRFIGWIMMVLLGDFFFIAGNWTPWAFPLGIAEVWSWYIRCVLHLPSGVAFGWLLHKSFGSQFLFHRSRLIWKCHRNG